MEREKLMHKIVELLEDWKVGKIDDDNFAGWMATYISDLNRLGVGERKR